jgi:hypothetical protein
MGMDVTGAGVEPWVTVPSGFDLGDKGKANLSIPVHADRGRVIGLQTTLRHQR